jgi:hypothetical protein
MSYTKDESNRLFQFKGDYALRTELARYQPKGNYVTNIQAANFQPKGDYITTVQAANFATKGDLANYQPKGAYQPAGDYALKSELANFQPKGAYQPAGDYALKSEIPNVANFQQKGDYALKSEIPNVTNFQPKGEYALKSEIPNPANFAAKGDLAAFQQKGDYALKSEIPNVANFAAKGELVDYALKSEIPNVDNFQQKGDYALKSEIPNVVNFAAKGDLADYALKSEIPNVANFQPKGEYALKNEIPNVANFQPKGEYALKSEIPNVANFQPKGEYALKSEIPNVANFQPKGEYALKSEIPNPANFAVKGDLANYRTLQNKVFSKANTFEDPAIQIGTDNTPRDQNIYSLSFGRTDNGTGMGLVPNDKKMFASTGTTGSILGTHINANGEWGIFSPGWTKLLAVQGESGNVRSRGDIQSGRDVFLGINTSGNSWRLHAPDDTRGLFAIAPIKDGNAQWHLAPQFFNNGNANIPGDLNVSSKLTVAGKEIDIANYYTKTQSDNTFQTKGNYQTAGNYAFASNVYNKTESYNKTEIDNNYARKSDLTNIKIRDTRDINTTPQGYYNMGQGVYREFKTITAIELGTLRNQVIQSLKVEWGGTAVLSGVIYCHLETIVNWSDMTGGPIYQYAHCPEGSYVRISNGLTTWNTWRVNINAQVSDNITNLQAANFATKNDLTNFQTKGNYQIAGNYQTAGNYAFASNVYNKTEIDNNYYTKTQSDNTFQRKGDLANYALKSDLSGKLTVQQLCIGDRWCIQQEGPAGVLVFRDYSGPVGSDNRYAMYPAQGNQKNL